MSEKTVLQISRRSLIQAMGGAAAVAAFATARSGQLVSAQDVVKASIWGNHPEWKDPMQEIIDAFQTANPNIQLELTMLTGPDYTTKLQTAVAGGQPSDIIGIGAGDIINKWVPSGDPPFIDLTDAVDISGLTDAAKLQVVVDGRTYAVPLAAYTVGVATNNTVLAKYNIAPPTTWDELKAAAQTISEGGDAGLVLGGKDWVHTFFMYIGLASSVLGFDGINQIRSGERKLTDPDLVAAAQLLLDMQPFYNAGFQATDYATAKAIFANGQGAMMVAGTADYTGYREVNPNADLSFVAWPGPAAGQSATTTGHELLYGVSKFSSPEVQAAATTFVAWLATTDAQQLVSDKIALPINVNVTSSVDPIRQATITAASGGDVPVWYEIPELAAVGTAVQDNFGALWAGELDAAGWAAVMQAAVVPSAATPTA